MSPASREMRERRYRRRLSPRDTIDRGLLVDRLARAFKDDEKIAVGGRPVLACGTGELHVVVSTQPTNLSAVKDEHRVFRNPVLRSEWLRIFAETAEHAADLKFAMETRLRGVPLKT